MSIIVLRSGKGSPLASSEIDANFTNLNNEKAPLADPALTGITQVGTDSANYQSLVGAVAAKTPIHSVAGTEPNIALALQSKGTGGIDLVAGSKGINISNGTTVTGITRTAGGSYTSPPTMTISAPTTADGVQAVVGALSLTIAGIALISGGTGYVAGDVGTTLTYVGGTFTTPATLTINSVVGGAIATYTVTNNGMYTVIPTNPISTSGGTGTGATFTCPVWAVFPTFPITNAGSGYIEQPTITFSGGGGSGAAAFATVGGSSIIRSLSNLSFYTPFGESVRIQDGGGGPGSSGATQNGYLALQGSTVPTGGAYVTSTTNALYLSSTSNGIQFFTNGAGSARQMYVTHTASAVNYVQVTGGATGADPVISVQGSDADRNLKLSGKGSGVVQTSTRLEVNTATANYWRISGAATGQTPVLSVLGSPDTNISLQLQPKGAGIVLTNQNTPVAYNATTTLLIADILSQIITSATATAVTLTLPTGALTDAGISVSTSAVNTAFEWSIINTGATNAVTLAAGANHTIVGSGAVALSTSARFKTVKTATNTFITYRIS